MKFKILNFLLILSTLFFLGCDSKKNNETSTTEETKIEKEEKPKIVSYELETTDNKKIKVTVDDSKIIFKEYPNKVILLNFFATWCPPCKAEIPNLIKLQKKYKKDFVVISILVERNKDNEELLNFIKEYNINYPVTNGKHNFAFSNKVGPVKNIPTMIMIDKNNEVYQKYIGLVPAEMMEIDIKQALKK